MGSPAPLVPAREGIVDAGEGRDRRRLPVRARTRSDEVSIDVAPRERRRRADHLARRVRISAADGDCRGRLSGARRAVRGGLSSALGHEEPSPARPRLDRRGATGADRDRRLSGRRLARARDVRHVRRASSPAIRTCAASSPITASAAFRSARISRSPAMSSCVIPRRRSASSTSRSASPRISAPSISCAPGRAPNISCPATRRRSPRRPARRRRSRPPRSTRTRRQDGDAAADAQDDRA